MVDEALDIYVKVTGKTGSRCARRSRTSGQTNCGRVVSGGEHAQKRPQRFQDKKDEGRKFFKRESKHKVMYGLNRNRKEEDRSLQEWTDERQMRAQAQERRLEAREREKREKTRWGRRTPTPKGAEHGRKCVNHESSSHRHTLKQATETRRQVRKSTLARWSSRWRRLSFTSGSLCTRSLSPSLSLGPWCQSSQLWCFTTSLGI